MIKTEILENNLIRTYSDEGKAIRKIGTDEIYDEAVDPIDSGRTYEEIDIEPTLITYSKYKLLLKLKEKNMWSRVKFILEKNDLMDLWNAAIEFTNLDENFKQGIELAKTTFKITDEQINEILMQCVK